MTEYKLPSREVLYRYEDILGYWDYYIGSPSVELKLRTYAIVKRTPKGAWIAIDSFYPIKNTGNRFVLLTARKKFACETKEEAMQSFLARKKRQVTILQKQLERARVALSKIKTMIKEVQNA